jgi:hypothetical protein
LIFPCRTIRTYPVYYDKERLGELQEEGVKDRLADKIQRGWTKVKIVELQNRVYIKASAEIPYEKVYPLLMAINEHGCDLDRPRHQRTRTSDAMGMQPRGRAGE